VVHGIVLADQQPRKDARSTVRADLGIRPDDMVVVTVANLRQQKAYPDLLSAARTLVDRHPDLHFLAAGQGPLEAEIRARIVKLGLSDNFRLLGHRDDVADLLAASDIFVLASEWEGYPIALMEAMAAGLACVATRVGGATDAIENGVNGLLLNPRDVDALVRHLESLIGDPGKRKRLAAAAAERASYFDISRASTHMASLYVGLTS
jgi:glycosyltransferase involved in cell wall biosynthesis